MIARGGRSRDQTPTRSPRPGAGTASGRWPGRSHGNGSSGKRASLPRRGGLVRRRSSSAGSAWIEDEGSEGGEAGADAGSSCAETRPARARRAMTTRDALTTPQGRTRRGGPRQEERPRAGRGDVERLRCRHSAPRARLDRRGDLDDGHRGAHPGRGHRIPHAPPRARLRQSDRGGDGHRLRRGGRGQRGDEPGALLGRWRVLRTS